MKVASERVMYEESSITTEIIEPFPTVRWMFVKELSPVIQKEDCVFLAWRELGVGDNKVSPLPWMLISSSGYEERLSEEKVTEERRNTPSCARIREAPPMELEEFVRLPSNATLIRERETRSLLRSH